MKVIVVWLKNTLKQYQAMSNTNNYQFIVDDIPDKDLDLFLRIMRNFSYRTKCRFQYKEGKSVKYPLIPVPPKKTKQIN